VWAFFVTMFIYRDYRWRDLPPSFTAECARGGDDAIACASSVGYVMALTQMPAKITAFFPTVSSDKTYPVPDQHPAAHPDAWSTWRCRFSSARRSCR
jgi:TRAP-type C4-dicarboxylate transport system permease large subunit